MTTVVSGVQTTGQLHLGNYLGAVKNWLDLARQGSTSFLFLADLHAITVPQDPEALRQSIRSMGRILMACGFAGEDLEYSNTYLFRQSAVLYHTELQWLLMGTARMGWLNRMTQFKDKGKKEGGVSVGLFAYPVLQAADILLYEPDFVPVGDDQRQHLQLTRDIVDKFNHDFGPTFKSPQPLVPSSNARVMSLQDPMRKMSKSDENASSRINLLDDETMISKKYRAAVADSETSLPSEEAGLEGRVAVANLVHLLSGVTGKSVADLLREDLGGKGNGNLKKHLTDATIHLLSPIQEVYKGLEDRQVQRIMDGNAVVASNKAHTTMDRVKSAMGLWD